MAIRMKENRQTELLAPAGNPEAFYGAVHAGADAVYLGGSRFGARAYAENFTAEEILQCIRYGHLLGRKIYLTVNTLMREQELQELPDWLRPFCEEGLDAVIVQDFGALRRIRECFPGLAIHASTQMTLCSRFGAKLLKEMGACRMVPARELSLKEIKTIRSRVDIELETFIHGAMCYCYSGQCLFSSILGGRSGNRGRCAQPCRLPYRIRTEAGGGREGYYLSLKDMCTVEHLPELMEAGIDSFKIEGRMKRPEYAAGVTAIYRKYMDRYRELSERLGREEAGRRFLVDREDSRSLNSLYIRSQVQDGYYFRRNGADMVTLADPSYGKNDEELLEKLRQDYLAERKRLPVFLKAFFHTGQPARLTLECQGRRAEILGDPVETAQKQPVTEENLRRQLGKLGDSAFSLQGMEIDLGEDAFYPLKQINELRRRGLQRLEEELLRSRGYGKRTPGEALSGETTGEAENPSGEETSEWEEASSKEAASGEAPGEGEALSHRRELAETGKFSPSTRSEGYAVLVETREQLRAVADWLKKHPKRRLSCLYISGDLLIPEEAVASDRAKEQGRGKNAGKLAAGDVTGKPLAVREEISELCGRLGKDCPLRIALPYLLREEDAGYWERLWTMAGENRLFSGFLIRSADQLGYLRQRREEDLKRPGKEPWFQLDANVYTWNRQALTELGQAGADGFSLPLELSAQEQRRLLETGADFEKLVYGRIPMMITANCLLRTGGSCKRPAGKSGGGDGKGSPAVLIDRRCKEFPVAVNCRHCMNIIYNSLPLSLYRECAGWEGRARLRLHFTVETKEEVGRILDAFLEKEELQLKEYTTGHEKRGAE